jgi:tRNA nucleotidyltransferase/poly(A) polymerase
METCAKEPSFKRYYPVNFTFKKPDYLFDKSLDNEELREIYEKTRMMYNKSPKKENRQPNNNGNFNKAVEKSKRGAYNFSNTNNQQPANTAFITRDEMMVTKRKKPPQEEKIIWTNPK